MNIGQYYKIKELLSDDNKLFIPDMQRDYCWSEKRYGNKKDSELVTQFIESLINLSEDNKKLVQLGMIYGYETDGFIYLCDGQQRITTLYLACGMLYRHIQNESIKQQLKNILISEQEIEDDQEPRLQYAIRESSLYFLRDLVWNYFIGEETIEPKDIIKKADWFYTEYSLDPTALNIVNALILIEKVLNKYTDKIEQLASYIIDKIQFLYYDMMSRKDGEDQFVVINTTGDPLTFTEIIKPFLLQKDIEKAEKWEEIDTYFWKNRGPEEKTSDKGMYEFLNMYLRIQKNSSNIYLEMLKDSSVGDVKSIYDYFKMFKLLQEWIDDDAIEFKSLILSLNIKNLGSKGCLILRELSYSGQKQQQKILLPLLKAMYVYQINSIQAYQLLRRLRKNYFSESFEERKNEYCDWHQIMDMIDEHKTFFDFMNADTDFWHTKYEIWKDTLNDDVRKRIEKIEDDKDFLGDISPIVFSSEDHITEERIQKLYTNYKHLTSLFDNNRQAIVLVGDSQKQQLSNEYRMFRFFVDKNRAGHADYQPWDVETCKFSVYRRYNTISSSETWKLCSLDENTMIDYLISYNTKSIKECNVFDNVKEGCSTQEVLTAWFAIKLLDARKQQKMLATWDNYGVTCLVKTSQNRISDKQELSIYNLICGYSHRSECILYANKEYWDSDQLILFDCTCGNIINYDTFMEIRNGVCQDMVLEGYHKYMDELMSQIYK